MLYVGFYTCGGTGFPKCRPCGPPDAQVRVRAGMNCRVGYGGMQGRCHGTQKGIHGRVITDVWDSIPIILPLMPGAPGASAGST